VIEAYLVFKSRREIFKISKLDNFKPIKPTKDFEEEIITLHAEGLNNKEIAEKLNFNIRAIAGRISALGLKHNGGTRTKINLINDTEIKCSICERIKDISLFPFVDKNKRYRQSFCSVCMATKIRKRNKSNINFYLNKKLTTMQSRSSKKLVDFEIDKNYVIYLFEKQNYKCFYSDNSLDWQSDGVRTDSPSIDKIIPDLGYIKGNVVITINKINTVKNNLNLDEIRKYMPFWYNRIIKHFSKEGVTYDGEFLIFPNGNKFPHKKLKGH